MNVLHTSFSGTSAAPSATAAASIERRAITADTTLTVADSGKELHLIPDADRQIKFPSAASKWAIAIRNGGNFDLTLVDASDVALEVPVLIPGTSVTVASDGTEVFCW